MLRYDKINIMKKLFVTDGKVENHKEAESRKADRLGRLSFGFYQKRLSFCVFLGH